MRRRQVVVIGSHNDTSYRDEAYQIGRHIGTRGWVLISGGRGGIMEAASRGAAEAGGIVVGILPDSNPDGANPFCSIVIPTGIGYARNLTNVLSGDVIVAIGGKSGTLSEIAYACQFGKPVIFCTFARGWSEKFLGTFGAESETRTFAARSIQDVCEQLDSILL